MLTTARIKAREERSEWLGGQLREAVPEGVDD